VHPYLPLRDSAEEQNGDLCLLEASKRLKIEDLHPHDLRHEGVSCLFGQGLVIQEAALISGHQSWTLLRQYTYPSVTTLLEKMNAGERKTQETPAQPA
jgi:integrase